MRADLYDPGPRPDPRAATGVAEFMLAADRLPALRAVRRLMTAQLAGIAAGAVLVDVGCGAGWETERLAAAFPAVRVVGIDHNPALIAAARARAPGGRPEWVHADPADPRLPAGSVDVLRVERVLVHVSDLAAAVEGLVELLGPAGRLVAFELDYAAVVLAPGHAPPALVHRITTALADSVSQPLAGRQLPALLHQHGLAVTGAGHAITLDHPVWRRIVGDIVSRAVGAGLLDADAVACWLAELDDPDFPGPRAVFTGIVTTAVRS